MPANIHGEMVYSFEKVMWHNITKPSKIPKGAVRILDEDFKGGFPVDLRPIKTFLNGADRETGDFVIVRGASPYEPEEIVFGNCSERFHPLQPREVCELFDTNVNEPAETMAFLGHGEDMFISWTMPEFDVRVGDSVKLFGIVRTGFDTLHGPHLFTSAVRPVCWNTIVMAEEWAKRNTDGKGQGSIWKGKGTNANLKRDFGYWMAHVQGRAKADTELVKNFFVKLAATPVKNDAEVHEVLFEAYPPVNKKAEYFPVQLRADEEKKEVDGDASRAEIRDGIYSLFAGAGTSISPDYWGVLNATTEYFCHVQPSKRPIAESVMFGGRQANTMKMVKTLSDRVR